MRTPSFRAVASSALFLVLAATTTLGSAVPAQRLSIKERATSTSCSPAFGEDQMYNIFVAGNGSAAWEWLPDFYSGNAKEGGNLFVSGTDSPEDGAYYFIPVNSTKSTTKPISTKTKTVNNYRLSLADQEKGQHCLVARSGKMLSTGSCEEDDSIFTVSCSSCSSATGNIGSSCRIQSNNSRYCTTWFKKQGELPGSPGYGPIGVKLCRKLVWQNWDIVEA
ncbi:hypothetical protein JCM5353_006872 [Sporobolomyces roseus]